MSPDRAGWTVVALDDVEAIAWRGTELTWRPLRRALGTLVAGFGAYTAERAGQQLVEPHTEREARGHEELYLVLRGHAAFELDGEPVDAPAGTFVVVRDPGVHRRAIAVQAGTAVIAIGGPPAFEPAASEWIEHARGLLRSDPERAAAIVAELEAERPGSPGARIGRALLLAARGEPEAAREVLSTVVAERPDYRAALAADPDLGPALGGG